jgi:hypothetical protein
MDEISYYKKIIKVLQEELSTIARRDSNNDLHNQSKISLREEDWVFGSVKGKVNYDVLNRNLIQIIPTSVNIYDGVHNLKEEDELTNLEKRELGISNTMKYTLKNDKG